MKRVNLIPGCILLSLLFPLVVNSQVKDIDGNIYKTVKIGDQVWMAENLKVTHFINGTPIPNVDNMIVWSKLTTPGYCWLNNNEEKFKQPYGALYNWYTVNTGKLCPAGWHVPTDAEWKSLEILPGMNPVVAEETGFTALPGGYRTVEGSFYSGSGSWWSASEYNMDRAISRYITKESGTVGRGKDSKKQGYSVRCIKDK